MRQGFLKISAIFRGRENGEEDDVDSPSPHCAIEQD